MQSVQLVLRKIEQLSQRNETVGLSLDQMVENAFAEHVESTREDWPEIKRTVETFLFASLALDGTPDKKFVIDD